MEIERPAPDEVETLADLWIDLAAGQRAHGSHFLAEENRARIREAMAGHALNDGLLVARLRGSTRTADPEGNAIGGFAMFSLESGKFRQDVTRGVVHNIYVREDHRGEGVGAALLAHAEDALRDRGADVVALEVLADNTAARRFYCRHGYEPYRVELEKEL